MIWVPASTEERQAAPIHTALADDPRFAELRSPFPPSQVGKLPRLWCKPCRDVSRSGRTCDAHKKLPCKVCRNNISTAHLHLDYVGHAAVTARLLSVDPAWNWEPVSVDEHGMPKLDGEHNLWIRLTVLGVTRLGYGTTDRTDDDSMKILIGDAIRNAAMRFGVALDLWSKEDLAPQAEAEAERQDEVARGLDEGEEKSSGRDWIADVKKLQSELSFDDKDSLTTGQAALTKLAAEANEAGEFQGAAKSAMASLRRRIEQSAKKLDKPEEAGDE